MEETMIVDPRFYVPTVAQRLKTAAHVLSRSLYWRIRNLPVQRWTAVAVAAVVHAAASL